MLAIASPSALDGLLFAEHQYSRPCQTAGGIGSRAQPHCMSGNHYGFGGHASLTTPASDPVSTLTVVYKDAAALVQSADRTRRPFREAFPSSIPRQPVNSRPSEEVMVTAFPERSAWKTRLLPSSSVTVALALPS